VSDWEPGTSAGTTPGPIWVSAADAADKAGTSPGRVREWAREGLIASQPSNGPMGQQVMVRLDEVVERARREPDGRSDFAQPAQAQQSPPPYPQVPAADLSPLMKTIPELVAQLTSATDRAARAETKVEFLNRQVNDLRRKLAEMPEDAGEMALEQTNVVEEEVQEDAPETEERLDSAFFADDLEEEQETAGEELSPTTIGAASLESIWDDDASDTGLQGSRRDQARDITAPPRKRRWWHRRRG
jgi:hypothetical protein